MVVPIGNLSLRLGYWHGHLAFPKRGIHEKRRYRRCSKAYRNAPNVRERAADGETREADLDAHQ